jgi:hypothetical protein
MDTEDVLMETNTAGNAAQKHATVQKLVLSFLTYVSTTKYLWDDVLLIYVCRNTCGTKQLRGAFRVLNCAGSVSVLECVRSGKVRCGGMSSYSVEVMQGLVLIQTYIKKL